MTPFLVKINRGIALGIIMLIGLAVYFVIDARAFESEAYDVRDTVLAFTEALEDLHKSFTPEANRDFLRRFFTEYREASWHPGVPSARQNAERSLDMFTGWAEENLPESISFTLLEITNIQKQSANAARVRLEISIQTSGTNEGTLFFNGFTDSDFWRLAADGTGVLTAETLMLRDGGNWRFARVSSRMRGGRLWR
jgi:hypothetical protein